MWALLLVGVLLAPSVRADPGISSPALDRGLVEWTFSNPANYTVVSASLGQGHATLAWRTGNFADTAESEFTAGLDLSNVNATASPGDLEINDTSEPGPVQNLTFQPNPAYLDDNYLNASAGGRPNFGTAPNLTIGNAGGSAWTRAVLRFPTLPLPWNATLVSAQLQLYMFKPITSGLMYFSAHRMLDNWTEEGSNWNTRDGTTLWNTTGGDFDPTMLDIAPGVTTAPGWSTWNITSLAVAWWTGTIPNDGLMVRQVADTILPLGEKNFYSSDSTNTTLRPRLLLSYTTPSSRGHFESRIFDAGSKAAWDRLGWSVTVPAGTAVAFRTRSGNALPADGSWSPWSAPVSASGSMIASPATRYVEYGVDLFTPSATSPVVHAVTLGFGLYAATGRIDTEPFAPASLQAWGNLSVNATVPAGTSVTLQYSQDNGTSWLPAAVDGSLSSALALPLILRVNLATNDTTFGPIVHGMSVSYRMHPAPAGDLLGAVYAWVLALVALLALAGLVVARRLRTEPFRAAALFLIHVDGRLVAHVGAEGMRDEHAASAMFTLVLTFVQDSFQGPGGTGGELKSLQVDEREVSIAKGKFMYLALVSEGTRPPHLSERMYEFLAGLEAGYGPRLEKWDGLREDILDLDGDLAWFLQRGYRKAHPGERIHYHP